MDISVTIRRNVGSTPMNALRWRDFQRSVTDNMWANPYPYTARQSIEVEGVPEEFATITGQAPVFYIERWAHIALTFEQDAIAVLLENHSHWHIIGADGSNTVGLPVQPVTYP